MDLGGVYLVDHVRLIGGVVIRSGGGSGTQKRYDKLIPSFRGPIDTLLVPGGDWSPWSKIYIPQVRHSNPLRLGVLWKSRPV